MSGRSAEPLQGREGLAITALLLVLVITAGWWALALWPLADAAPQWLLRTRAVCFGTVSSGLPDASGWIALILQPTLMFGVLFSVWGGAVRGGLRSLSGRPAGRVALLLAMISLLTGAVAVGTRVSGGWVPQGIARAEPALAAAADYPRLDRAVPRFQLLDQNGEEVSQDRFVGRPVFVTFAFAHCSTICPLVVAETLQAQRQLADLAPVVLVITLDPWRDTPSRLAYIAGKWGLGEDAYVLSGEVEAVNRTLDGWQVPRSRDPYTGDVAHPALVYLINGEGEVVYATTGDTELLAELARRL